MKKVLPLAIAAALALPAVAMADATIYGKIRTSVDYLDWSTDDDIIDLNDLFGDNTMVQINSWASRLGVKGSEDLGNGLKAIYQIEAQVNFADQDNEFGTGTSLFTGRNTFVGLAGGWGTFLIGRHDTPMKMSTSKLDFFQDTSADFNQAYSAFFADRRADGTVAYVSPNWAGLTFAAALVPGENANANGIGDAYSVAAMYDNGGLYLSGAYTGADGQIDALNDGAPAHICIDDFNQVVVCPASPDTIDDLTQWRLGAGFDAGGWRVAAVYENEQYDHVLGGTAFDFNKWDLSGGWTIGNGEIKGTYFTWDESEHDVDNSGWTLGYDYNFSKRTQVYVLWTDSTIDYNVPGVGDDDLQIISLGLNTAF